MTTMYVNWGESKVKLTWKRDNQLPIQDLITSVHGFCFHEDKLLLVDLIHRGWDFPGGHIQSTENPEQCFKREAMEEGYVDGECHLLGYIIVDHNNNPNWDEESPYPKVGYQIFYRMNIEQIYTFEAEHESAQRIFINPKDVADYYHDWQELYQEILNYASSLIEL
ncbi:MAG: NUDIX domain-containing protein [Bacillota bacterium]|nr:NUDIX domain-containing protein [Bacillota bacterium]